MTGACTSASSKPHGRARRPARGRATDRRAETTRCGLPRRRRPSPDRRSAVAGASPMLRARGRRPAARPARRRIARRTSRASSCERRRAAASTPTSATRVHPLRRDGGERERVWAAGRPADDGEPIDLERTRASSLGPGAQRRAARPRARSGRPRAGARRATRRSCRRDAARAASRRRRAGRRPACPAGSPTSSTLSADDERRAHPARSMICDRAPERVSPRPRASPSDRRARRGRRRASRRCARDPIRCTRRSCGVLAEVRELDHRAARLQRARATA